MVTDIMAQDSKCKAKASYTSNIPQTSIGHCLGLHLRGIGFLKHIAPIGLRGPNGSPRSPDDSSERGLKGS